MVRPPAQPGGTAQRRSEAVNGQTGARANNLQAASGGQRLHDHAARSPRARHGPLPGSSRPICRLKLHRAGSIVQIPNSTIHQHTALHFAEHER